MPHDLDVRMTSHDRHDPLLVAALAAADLAGTERDQAIALTRSCTDCSALHDDLVALARATAAAPPPISTRPRDFFLTPADAARLRPSGWRRLIGGVAAPRAAMTRPLGVGLATLGLVGLLIGNVRLDLGSSSATPAAAGVAASAATGKAAPEAATSTGGRTSQGSGDAAAVPPTSAVPAASAAPADATGQNFGASTASSAPRSLDGGDLAPITAAGGGSAGSSERPQQTSRDLSAASEISPEPSRPWNLLFGAAVVLGIGLLAVSRLSGRPAR